MYLRGWCLHRSRHLNSGCGFKDDTGLPQKVLFCWARYKSTFFGQEVLFSRFEKISFYFFFYISSLVGRSYSCRIILKLLCRRIYDTDIFLSVKIKIYNIIKYIFLNNIQKIYNTNLFYIALKYKKII